jgi:hypothetical protein
MQGHLLAAAVVTVAVGIVHSVLGEMLVFRKLRASGIVPTSAAPPLQSRNVRILWATWHLASAFGFGFAVILWSLGRRGSSPDPMLMQAIVLAFGVGATLVLVATRGRHPGWIGLLTVAVLTHLGRA